MSKLRRSVPLVTLAAGLAVGLLIGVGMMFGAVWTISGDAKVTRTPLPTFDATLHASTAQRGKSLSIATGAIDDDVEGLFVLDHLTGDLHCWVVNSRAVMTGGFVGQFRANVVADLKIQKDKEADLLLTTGRVIPMRGLGGGRPAMCICYVADSNTGNVAAYTLSWNSTAAVSSRIQVGPLVRIATGKGRPVVQRD